MKRALLIALALAGCASDLDEPWQLDHDRIIAVRATPPRIVAGERSTIDLLAGYEEAPLEERSPDAAVVLSPASLADVLDTSTWTVTAPDDDRLAAARAELGLEPGAPVPLQLGVAARWPYPVQSVDGTSFTATKMVWLGDSADNPQLTGMRMNGAEMPDAGELVMPMSEQVPLLIDADDTVDIVSWLTSCGEMHDSDLHAAYIVAPAEPCEGELAVVKRDDKGGVAWRIWPIRAE